jgi:hypothetical protein
MTLEMPDASKMASRSHLAGLLLSAALVLPGAGHLGGHIVVASCGFSAGRSIFELRKIVIVVLNLLDSGLFDGHAVLFPARRHGCISTISRVGPTPPRRFTLLA